MGLLVDEAPAEVVGNVELLYGRCVAATFSTRKLRSQVLLGGKPLPATNEGLLGLPSATPSPFGDLTNGTNVVDTSVRNAVEFTDVSISPQLRHELAQRFAETFRVPSCVVECYKLCVYPKGAGFKAHQDTPLPDMVGTAVLDLSAHWRAGGDLILDVDGKRHTPSGDNTTLFLPFVRHEVTPIQRGHRVSVLCRIYRPGSVEAASPKTSTLDWLSGTVDKDKLPLVEGKGGGRMLCDGHCRYRVFEPETAVAALQALMRTPHRRRRLFFLARNVYSASQMQRLAQPKRVLVGRDRDLFVQLQAHEDLRVWVTPAVRVEARDIPTEDSAVEHNQLGYFDEGLLRSALDGNNLAAVVPKHPHLAALFEPDDRVDMVAHCGPTGEGFCLLSEHLQYIEHTGNQSQEGYERNLYYSVAIVVQKADTPYHGADVVRARVAAAQAART